MILILAKPSTHSKKAAAVGNILKVTKNIDIKKNIIKNFDRYLIN